MTNFFSPQKGFIYFALWQWYASTFNPSLPHVGTCAGKEFAAFTGAGILSSYLLLFIFFYAATYKRPSRSSCSVAKMTATFEKANKGEILEAADGMKWHTKEGLRLRD
jgi:fatty acid elongase 3